MTTMTPPRAEPNRPKLLDELADSARHKGHPETTAAVMVSWCRRFILFHGKRHPQEMGQGEIGRFLTDVAQTEAQALVAIEAAREASPLDALSDLSLDDVKAAAAASRRLNADTSRMAV
jgi:hypothetical protein